MIHSTGPVWMLYHNNYIVIEHQYIYTKLLNGDLNLTHLVEYAFILNNMDLRILQVLFEYTYIHCQNKYIYTVCENGGCSEREKVAAAADRVSYLSCFSFFHFPAWYRSVSVQCVGRRNIFLRSHIL